jgi:hypothetical protein
MITTRLSPGFKGTLHGYDTRQQPGYRIVNERYIETGRTEAVNVACYEIDLTARQKLSDGSAQGQRQAAGSP